jgi:hypothetical protein
MHQRAVGMDLGRQRELFEVALDELHTNLNMTNQVLEISLENTGNELVILRYELPSN